ncbi:MAG: hypothetical protein OEW52_07180 [Thermoleophilia bacterium]|nr:hypothetical protein [Thermoleophilia bacterium]MDH4340526.1 hypothetical protein [Thermoleophilia bacterium]MDH5280919.1 hypothetical protein [Thermoleophilia bacterium]
MFLTSLPFDYAKLVDCGDRVRTARKRNADSRLRRLSRPSEA